MSACFPFGFGLFLFPFKGGGGCRKPSSDIKCYLFFKSETSVVTARVCLDVSAFTFTCQYLIPMQPVHKHHTAFVFYLLRELCMGPASCSPSGLSLRQFSFFFFVAIFKHKMHKTMGKNLLFHLFSTPVLIACCLF